jgi:site-specific recombinase XerD
MLLLSNQKVWIACQSVTFRHFIVYDYKINDKKSTVRAEGSAKQLSQSFGGMRVVGITTPKINEHIERRQSEGASNASINRELAALKRMFNLGAR